MVWWLMSNWVKWNNILCQSNYNEIAKLKRRNKYNASAEINMIKFMHRAGFFIRSTFWLFHTTKCIYNAFLMIGDGVRVKSHWSDLHRCWNSIFCPRSQFAHTLNCTPTPINKRNPNVFSRKWKIERNKSFFDRIDFHFDANKSHHDIDMALNEFWECNANDNQFRWINQSATSLNGC